MQRLHAVCCVPLCRRQTQDKSLKLLGPMLSWVAAQSRNAAFVGAVDVPFQVLGTELSP